MDTTGGIYMPKKTPTTNKFGVSDDFDLVKEIVMSQPILFDKVLMKIRKIREDMSVSIFQEAGKQYSRQKAKGSNSK
jgi:hypothetical protein